MSPITTTLHHPSSPLPACLQACLDAEYRMRVEQERRVIEEQRARAAEAEAQRRRWVRGQTRAGFDGPLRPRGRAGTAFSKRGQGRHP